MATAIEITGQTFHRLTARTKRTIRIRNRSRILWECDCVCGKTAEATADQLRGGVVQSCGCLHRERTSAANKKHGRSGTRVYRCWASMVKRCTEPNTTGYKYWGGRGIKVCARWRKSFEAFLADMGEPPTDRHSIDRYPNADGDYRPGNCRWATSEEQNNNSRKNHNITFNGITQSIARWAEQIGIRPRLLQARISRLGWTIERALTEKPNPKRQAPKLK